MLFIIKNQNFLNTKCRDNVVLEKLNGVLQRCRPLPYDDDIRKVTCY